MNSKSPGPLTLAGCAALITLLSGCTVKHDNADLIRGKQLFVAKCGSCHTLAHASTKGIVGPNLDEAFQQSLRDGFRRSTLRGVVHAQILNPGTAGVMPGGLVTGRLANDVAAYVSTVAAQPGQDSGLLALAVKQAGAGKPALVVGGVLEVDADPSGQLAFVTSKAIAPTGSVTVKMKNPSSTQHNIAIEGNGVNAAGPIVASGGVSQFKATLKAGTYTYFCQVPGHRAAGMVGTLVVK